MNKDLEKISEDFREKARKKGALFTLSLFSKCKLKTDPNMDTIGITLGKVPPEIIVGQEFLNKLRHTKEGSSTVILHELMHLMTTPSLAEVKANRSDLLYPLKEVFRELKEKKKAPQHLELNPKFLDSFLAWTANMGADAEINDFIAQSWGSAGFDEMKRIGYPPITPRSIETLTPKQGPLRASNWVYYMERLILQKAEDLKKADLNNLTQGKLDSMFIDPTNSGNFDKHTDPFEMSDEELEEEVKNSERLVRISDEQAGQFVSEEADILLHGKQLGIGANTKGLLKHPVKTIQRTNQAPKRKRLIERIRSQMLRITTNSNYNRRWTPPHRIIEGLPSESVTNNSRNQGRDKAFVVVIDVSGSVVGDQEMVAEISRLLSYMLKRKMVEKAYCFSDRLGEAVWNGGSLKFSVWEGGTVWENEFNETILKDMNKPFVEILMLTDGYVYWANNSDRNDRAKIHVITLLEGQDGVSTL
jgi:hypothetical protein